MKSSDYRLFKKISEARRAKIDEWSRTYVVRWSETIERNEAYEAFSAACDFCLRTTDKGTESRRAQHELFSDWFSDVAIRSSVCALSGKQPLANAARSL
jgi:hypothetical protein